MGNALHVSWVFAKHPVELVTLIIIFITILVIFSIPSSGGSWCKSVSRRLNNTEMTIGQVYGQMLAHQGK